MFAKNSNLDSRKSILFTFCAFAVLPKLFQALGWTGVFMHQMNRKIKNYIVEKLTKGRTVLPFFKVAPSEYHFTKNQKNALMPYAARGGGGA